MDSRQTRSNDDTYACYLLGFSPSDERLKQSELLLLSQFGIEHCTFGSITAWFKRIERCEFEGPVAEKNLADIEWLTPRVLAHESVVSSISQQIPFYPSRFGALFSSLDPLREIALSNTTLLHAFFVRIRRKSEWGIKFFGDSARMAELTAQREGILHDGKVTSGANYLKLRQMQRAQSVAATSVFQSLINLATEHLQLRYSELARRPIHNTAKTASTEQLQGNFAILVRNDESEHLIAWANEWNAEQFERSGMRTQISGPWPAYSFCPKLIDLAEVEKAA
ncbi:MAG: GvpL/GvpF family gas vesicle protein [Pirellulaceae bacterium]|nr:GvpL/GvpF family gas vesicle protein [Pirellulaceae bacterium]